MPISIYEGAPGGGKSYHAVLEIKKAVDSGKPVYTNVDGLKPHKFSHPELIHLWGPDEVQRLWYHLPKNSLAVIDEALVPFGDDFGRNEDTNERDVAELKKWATQHRHDGQDAIFIVQDAWMLARVVRNVSSVRINFHNQGHLGFASRCRVKYFSPTKCRTPFKVENKKYDKEVFKLYESVKKGSVLASTKGKNILLRPFVVVPVLLFCFSSYFMAGLIDRKPSGIKHEKVVESPHSNSVTYQPDLVGKSTQPPSNQVADISNRIGKSFISDMNKSKPSNEIAGCFATPDVCTCTTSSGKKVDTKLSVCLSRLGIKSLPVRSAPVHRQPDLPTFLRYRLAQFKRLHPYADAPVYIHGADGWQIVND